MNRRGGQITQITPLANIGAPREMGQPQALAGPIKKASRELDSREASCVKIRQHLLSHLRYYHRLRELNYRVRNGNGCGLSNMVTGKEPAGRSNPRWPCSRQRLDERIAADAAGRLLGRVVAECVRAGELTATGVAGQHRPTRTIFRNEDSHGSQSTRSLWARALDQCGQAFVR